MAVSQHGPVDRLIGALVIAVPMLLLTLLIPGAFGGGDIKLMAVSGWFLGCAPVICAMFFGILTGGTYAGVMLATKKLGGKDHFAFGPFLAAGLMIGAVWGCDRHLVSSIFIERKRYGTISLHGKKYEW